MKIKMILMKISKEIAKMKSKILKKLLKTQLCSLLMMKFLKLK